jgi:Cytochrome c7 and related cytochrome c
MSLFKPWSNTVARLSLAGIALGAAGALGGMMIYVRSPLYTQQADPIDQPVQFDHRHHVGEEGIDCRYCHTQVEKAASAGYPPTSLCLNCHAQIWNKSPKLAPVRESFFTNTPIPWERVHKLPHYVYFNHSIHVAKGVGCVTCHGRIDKMASVEKFASLEMSWCLECHRSPEKYLRPKDEVVNLQWEAPSTTEAAVRELVLHGLAKSESEALPLLAGSDDPRVAFGLALVDRHDVHTRTSCDTCHR